MAKKYKYYLVRSVKDSFLYARGEAFENDYLEGLTLVRLSDINDSLLFNGNYSIIDIKSGLSVYSMKSKKKLLDLWNERKLNLEYDLKGRIERARTTDSYKRAINLIEAEKVIRKASGYNVED